MLTLVLQLGEPPVDLASRDRRPGRSTWNSRLRPSETVSVTCMALDDFAAEGGAWRLTIVLRMRRCPLEWCGRRGSNPHDLRHGNLNPARLPIPPRPQRASSRNGSGRAARLISCGTSAAHAKNRPAARSRPDAEIDEQPPVDRAAAPPAGPRRSGPGRPRCRPRHAARPRRRRPRRPASPAPAARRQKPASTSPEPGGGEPGRGIVGDRGPAVRRRHHRVGALQQHDRAGRGRRRARPLELRRRFRRLRQLPEQAAELAFVRGQQHRRLPAP